MPLAEIERKKEMTYLSQADTTHQQTLLGTNGNEYLSNSLTRLTLIAAMERYSSIRSLYSKFPTRAYSPAE